jgi:hypothetical protein
LLFPEPKRFKEVILEAFEINMPLELIAFPS